VATTYIKVEDGDDVETDEFIKSCFAVGIRDLYDDSPLKQLADIMAPVITKNMKKMSRNRKSYSNGEAGKYIHMILTSAYGIGVGYSRVTHGEISREELEEIVATTNITTEPK
jgi:hypothetical protein